MEILVLRFSGIHAWMDDLDWRIGDAIVNILAD